MGWVFFFFFFGLNHGSDNIWIPCDIGRSAPSLRICFGDLAEALKVKTQVPLDAVDGSGKSRSRTEDNMWHGGCDPHDLPRCLHSLPQAEVEHDDDQRQAVHGLPPARAQVINDMAVLEVQHPMPGVGQTGITEGHCLPTQNCNPTAEMVLRPTWQDQRPHSDGPGPPAPAEGQGPPDVSWGRWEWHAGGHRGPALAFHLSTLRLVLQGDWCLVVRDPCSTECS